MKKLGITGGIGSGKSLVGQFLKEAGIPVIDADTIVHELLETDPLTKEAIFETFGPEVFTRSTSDNPVSLNSAIVNRKLLGQRIFQTTHHRKQLEEILHPKVRAHIKAFFQQQEDEKSHACAAALIPLLFENDVESGWSLFFDEIWVVKATPQQQLERVQQSRGLSLENIQRRIDAQLPLEYKCIRATRVIDNTENLENTHSQVLAALEQLINQKESE